MNIILNQSTVGFTVKRNTASVLNLDWNHVNDVLIHERPLNLEVHSGTASSTETNLVKLKWGMELLETPHIRVLISESSALFNQLSKAKSSQGMLTSKELIQFSRRFRSVVHASCEGLEVSNSHLLPLFRNIEMIWHLCEILFLDISSPGVLMNQLLAWIRWHFPQNTRRAEEVLRSQDPVNHPSFWNAIYGFLIRGETDSAINFLELYSETNKSDQVMCLIEILRKMPLYSHGMLSHEVDMRWNIWSEEVKQILATGYFEEQIPLKNILKILAGNDEALSAIRNEESTWYHLLVSKLLYTDPFLKSTELITLAEESLCAFGVRGQPADTTDRVLLAAFNYDLMQVIRESCLFHDNWWFISHFVDLLNSGQQLQNHQIQDETKLRDFLILDYADGIMSHQSLWSMAIDYYDSCGDSGRFRLELTLERIPLTSERLAFKIIDIANKRNLRPVSRTVARVLSLKWLSQNKLSPALVWAIRAEDSTLCSQMSDMILRNFFKTGNFAESDVLATLGPNMLTSDKLTFVAKYYEFHQLRNANHLEQAAELLISLISSKISPPFFSIQLISDSLPLLESSKNVMTADQMAKLLASLEDLVDRRTPLPGLRHTPDPPEDVFKEQEMKIRETIARNLARAIIV